MGADFLFKSWRRRHMRLVGSNLFAFNEMTRKITSTIDLRKAIAVRDDRQEINIRSPASATSTRSQYTEFEGVERSFRLIFKNNQEIAFYADTDAEKKHWWVILLSPWYSFWLLYRLDVLGVLVGHIPPNPLWAELLFQRQEAAAQRKQATSPTSPSSIPRPITSPQNRWASDTLLSSPLIPVVRFERIFSLVSLVCFSSLSS